MIDVRLLTSRTSVEVCDQLERMTAYFESLQFEGFPIGETSRIKRLHSDRAGEFTAPYFERFLSSHKSIYHTLTTGYDPQANGTAERSVGLIKSLAARALSSSGLDPSYWSYAVRYAAQSLICSALLSAFTSFWHYCRCSGPWSQGCEISSVSIPHGETALLGSPSRPDLICAMCT